MLYLLLVTDKKKMTWRPTDMLLSFSAITTSLMTPQNLATYRSDFEFDSGSKTMNQFLKL